MGVSFLTCIVRRHYRVAKKTYQCSYAANFLYKDYKLPRVDFIFTYLAANCIRARAHLPETLLNMFKNPAIIKSGRKLPPDENCRRCSTPLVQKYPQKY